VELCRRASKWRSLGPPCAPAPVPNDELCAARALAAHSLALAVCARVPGAARVSYRSSATVALHGGNSPAALATVWGPVVSRRRRVATVSSPLGFTPGKHPRPSRVLAISRVSSGWVLSAVHRIGQSVGCGHAESTRNGVSITRLASLVISSGMRAAEDISHSPATPPRAFSGLAGWRLCLLRCAHCACDWRLLCRHSNANTPAFARATDHRSNTPTAGHCRATDSVDPTCQSVRSLCWLSHYALSPPSLLSTLPLRLSAKRHNLWLNVTVW